VHLEAGASAQVYLDSWRRGAADLHITYFDARKELPVSRLPPRSRWSGAPAA